MVRQGEIIKINFNPNRGHEQVGYRPAVVVSNDVFNSHNTVVMVCPITNTTRPYPTHIRLKGLETTGSIMCEQMRSLDINSRGYKRVEQLPQDVLEEVIDIIYGSIEIV